MPLSGAMDLSPFDRAAKRIPSIAVSLVDGGSRHVGGVGDLTGTSGVETLCWEIGSISKVFTGILLADMTMRGEVDLDDAIGLHVPADVAGRLPSLAEQPTLRDLATHTAGLPRLPRSWVRRIGKDPNPYASLTEVDVWQELGPSIVRPKRRRVRYSNFGMGLLGHLLGHTAGAPYADLVADRVLRPLGLNATGVALGTPVPGVRGKDRPTPPWTFGALQGAGAIRSTVSDMLAFAEAVIEPPGTPVGAALRLAAAPAYQGRIVATGLGWQMRYDGVLWHNGGTYGAASFIAVDVEKQRAIVAFGNRGPRLTAPLDRAAWRTFDLMGRNRTSL